jgi:hypothetical protein
MILFTLRELYVSSREETSMHKGIHRMIKTILVAAVGLTFLLADAASAQTTDQCVQVRAAVAQYGYKAAKAHGDATLSPDEVRAASTCLKRNPVAAKHHSARQIIIQ